MSVFEDVTFKNEGYLIGPFAYDSFDQLQINGNRYFLNYLSVPRAYPSVRTDFVPVLLSEEKYALARDYKKIPIKIWGSVVCFKSQQREIVDQFFIASNLNEFSSEARFNNSIKLTGELCSPLTYWALPSGNILTYFRLKTQGPNESNEVICYARKIQTDVALPGVKKGDLISLAGRLQARQTLKNGVKIFSNPVSVGMFQSITYADTQKTFKPKHNSWTERS